LGNLKERDHLEDQGIDGMIILKCVFEKEGGAWTGLFRLRTWTVGGPL
jgi:hypothetical protein